MFGKDENKLPPAVAKKTDDTKYVSIVKIIQKDKSENTVCLFAEDPNEIFMKTATFESVYKSKGEIAGVEVVGTYVKTKLKVVTEG